MAPSTKFLVVGLIHFLVTVRPTEAILRSAEPPPLALRNEAPLMRTDASLMLLMLKLRLACNDSEDKNALPPKV